MIGGCRCAVPVWGISHRKRGDAVHPEALGDCERPKLLRCAHCNATKLIRCGATREDRCTGCGLRHNRKLKRLCGSGFTGRPSGFFLLTGTAPGAAGGFPFDPALCVIKGKHRCDGKRGCRVNELQAAEWNSHAPQVWSWVMTEIRRRLPGVDVQFFKAWETQDRGMLHLHAIIWALGVSEARMRAIWQDVLSTVYDVNGYRFAWGVQSKCDRIGSASSVPEMMELLGVDPDDAAELVEAAEVESQRRSARYLAKYCTKGGRRATTIHRTTGEIRRDGSGYRTWSASRRWGQTMKSIREEQRAWWAAGSVVTRSGTPTGAEGALDPDSDFYADTDHVVSLLGSLLGAETV